MKKKSRVMAAVLAVSLVIGLAGCNTQNTAGSKEGSATENATGAGVTDTASGEMNDKYRFCNDYHLYSETADGFVQRDFTGKPIETFTYEKPETGKDSFIRLFGVTNEEIFYVEKGKKEDKLWCAPLDKDSHRPQMAEAGEVLSEETIDVSGGLYADSHYIAFFTVFMNKLVEYDREKGKKIPVDNTSSDTTYGPPYGPFTYQKDAWEDTVLLSKDTDDPVVYQEGIYLHTIGSGRVTKLEEYSRVKGQRESVYVASQGDVIAVCDSDGYYGAPAIYVYDTGTGERREIVSRKKWKKKLKENFDSSCIITDLYMVGERLYFLIQTLGEVDYGQYYIWSCPLSGEGGLRMEKERNQFLRNLEKQAGEDASANIQNILKDRIYAYTYEENEEDEEDEDDWEDEIWGVETWEAENGWQNEDNVQFYMYRTDTGEVVKLNQDDPELALAFMK